MSKANWHSCGAAKLKPLRSRSEVRSKMLGARDGWEKKRQRGSSRTGQAALQDLSETRMRPEIRAASWSVAALCRFSLGAGRGRHINSHSQIRSAWGLNFE